MMSKVCLAFFLAFIVTLGRAEDFECRSNIESSDNHAELMVLLKGLLGKITTLESGLKSTQKAVLLIQSNCNQNSNGIPAALKSLALTRKTECPPNHQLFEGACYFFSTDKENWYAAQQICQGMGGNLAKISTDSEYQFLQSTITDETWVGLNDQDREGTYTWISDGSVGLTGTSWWHSGEPNNDNSGEDCIEFKNIDGQYELNDIPCAFTQLYVCQSEVIYY